MDTWDSVMERHSRITPMKGEENEFVYPLTPIHHWLQIVPEVLKSLAHLSLAKETLQTNSIAGA